MWHAHCSLPLRAQHESMAEVADPRYDHQSGATTMRRPLSAFRPTVLLPALLLVGLAASPGAAVAQPAPAPGPPPAAAAPAAHGRGQDPDSVAPGPRGQPR